MQAAIGAIPLAQGVAGGEVILAIAALSILVTAPLGAWAIPTFAPKLLARGVVDPTKVATTQNTVFLAVVSPSSADSTSVKSVLTKAAEFARRNDADVIVLQISQDESVQAKQSAREPITVLTQRMLADVRHQVMVTIGVTPDEIIRIAKDVNASEIIVSKQVPDSSSAMSPLVGITARAVIEASPVPVITVSAAR